MSLSKLLEVLGHTGADSSVGSSSRSGETGTTEHRTVVHECRTCGTSVSGTTTRCPACEGRDIVTYAIE
ncbi:hypothetical protein HALLA_20655 (plasmid) [Halostagnicola larsenii XH-48]|uniref:Small CPxCG-related zinc finger protein n=1 Tax=Halostagnicola larsenii XH-48 TaxID=797299 RepID=W0JUR8_9EURY|nr:hypothetical protein [Halostagnicola larsenii]AHG02316.1 hypothetical protein HALLA_20655 [Halostagnicola larsenii XH-48]